MNVKSSMISMGPPFALSVSKGERRVFPQPARDDAPGYGWGSPVGTSLFKSEQVLVMNGDSFCDAKLNFIWEWHLTRRANATVVLARVSDTARYDRVHTAADGTILSFAEKSKQSDPGWINAGIYLLARSLLLTIAGNTVVSLEHDVFPSWIGQGFYGYQCHGRLLDIGTPESYRAAEHFFGWRATGR